eukprot:Lithocolla_globosa_v1_NODE_5694_length_1200_cov_10.590393.p1 type:complete len:333 gc:universal NODE_5694_length_1200_cov_10.590393:57-1055(+)
MGFELEWLKEVSLDKIPLKKKAKTGNAVICLSHTNNVIEAMRVLEKYGMLSAPVWNNEEKKFIGSMDMHHVVSLLASTFHDKKELFGNPGEVHQLMGKDNLFTSEPISKVWDFSVRNPFYNMKTTDSVYDTIQAMVGNKQVRRALVFKTDGEELNPDNLTSLVSQAAVIRYIYSHKDKLGSALNTPLQDVFKGVDWVKNKSQVVSVHMNDLMLEACSLMNKHTISGLAVLDDEQKLIGTLSIRDLSALMNEDKLDLSRLRWHVHHFLNYVRQLSIDERFPAISVKKTDTFGTLIGKVASTGVHRLFIVDEHNSPVGVFSTSDVLKGLFEFST